VREHYAWDFNISSQLVFDIIIASQFGSRIHNGPEDGRSRWPLSHRAVASDMQRRTDNRSKIVWSVFYRRKVARRHGRCDCRPAKIICQVSKQVIDASGSAVGSKTTYGEIGEGHSAYLHYERRRLQPASLASLWFSMPYIYQLFSHAGVVTGPSELFPMYASIRESALWLQTIGTL